MSRRHFSFACEGEVLAGTLDEAGGPAGLLVVSGGNETRAGAFSGMAELAARLAAAGHPVLRFDRRGTGDSTGENAGFRGSGPDIAAAIAAFRAEVPGLRRIVGLGNCDAASALMLAGGAGCDALVLANPWTFDAEAAEQHSGAELRRRYAEKLRNPRELARLLAGKVSLAKLAGGLRRALVPGSAGGSVLASEMAGALARYQGEARILLAERDRTAQAFRENWPGGAWPVEICAGASHAFAEAEAREWLFGRVVEALRGA
jgi:exosortase A-associated hydrolase 1